MDVVRERAAPRHQFISRLSVVAASSCILKSSGRADQAMLAAGLRRSWSDLAMRSRTAVALLVYSKMTYYVALSFLASVHGPSQKPWLPPWFVGQVRKVVEAQRLMFSA